VTCINAGRNADAGPVLPVGAIPGPHWLTAGPCDVTAGPTPYDNGQIGHHPEESEHADIA
jgi:hypothetical protein